MASLLHSLIRQPLLHFLLAAVCIFILHELRNSPVINSADDTSRQILVNRNTLLNYLQFRNSEFNPEHFGERLDAMSPAQRQDLVDDYIREEALYREALALGLEQGDYIIRQRLVQKTEYLLDSLSEEPVISEDDIKAWFVSNRALYHQDEVYTFTHIFFDGNNGGSAEALLRAEIVLSENPLLSKAEAGQYGDRFPFLRNYHQRSRDFVINNFDEEFVAAMDKLDVSKPQWAGPIASRYGVHLVYLSGRSEGTDPALEAVRNQVLNDYRYQLSLQMREAAERRVIAAYEVILELP